MIKVKISELIDSISTLQKLAQKDFKAKLAWSIARLLKAAEAEIQSFNDTRMDLIRKYGEKDDNGELITDEKGNCTLIKDKVQDFNAELNELLASEIEINANPINIEMLEDLDFTPAEMSVLEPFVEFE
jgi:hypothetical protein